MTSTNENKPKALVFLAPGAEEMEVVITVDVLRRGGVNVTLASITDDKEPIKCSRNVLIVPDATFEEATSSHIDYDIVVIPGGLGGANALANSKKVGSILQKQEAESKNGKRKFLAAICAGPQVFLSHNIGLGCRLTSHPSIKEKLETHYQYVDDEKVVIDGTYITSRGPGTAFAFALAIVETLTDKKIAESIIKPMML